MLQLCDFHLRRLSTFKYLHHLFIKNKQTTQQLHFSVEIHAQAHCFTSYGTKAVCLQSLFFFNINNDIYLWHFYAVYLSIKVALSQCSAFSIYHSNFYLLFKRLLSASAVKCSLKSTSHQVNCQVETLTSRVVSFKCQELLILSSWSSTSQSSDSPSSFSHEPPFQVKV